MLTMKEKGILLYIISHCDRIQTKVVGVSRENFESNDDVKEIVCFNLFQIGELAKHLDQAFVSRYSKMPWSAIKGMRDIIVHGYGTINLSQVWMTATSDIGPLRDYCEKILNEDALNNQAAK